MAATPHLPGRAYQLRIRLLDVEPPIWRRFVVPSAYPLHLVHETIQIVMGWRNCHLHEFRINGRRYGDPDPDFETDVLDEFGERISKFIRRPGKTFEYWYDFGDDWWHRIELEAVLTGDESRECPVCLDGAHACPPEDCGGVDGYARLLDILSDPCDEEHESMREWADGMVGGHYGPEHFDLEAVNATLHAPRAPGPVLLGKPLDRLVRSLDPAPPSMGARAQIPAAFRGHQLNGVPVEEVVRIAAAFVVAALTPPESEEAPTKEELMALEDEITTLIGVFDRDARSFLQDLLNELRYARRLPD